MTKVGNATEVVLTYVSGVGGGGLFAVRLNGVKLKSALEIIFRRKHRCRFKIRYCTDAMAD